MIAVQRMSVRAVLRDRTVLKRTAIGTAVAMVEVAVLANTVFRPSDRLVMRVPDARVNAPADAVAQSLVAAYLLVADDPQVGARALAPFGRNPAWNVSSGDGVKRRVEATQIAGVTVRRDNGDRIVTVQA